MWRDDALLYDIWDSAKAILNYTQGVNWDGFSKDGFLQDAVIRRLEIIGEAAGKVSAETQKKHSQLPWREMKDTRNRIIHGYDSVRLDIIWDIVENNLPGLVQELEKIVPPKP
jgi:uncharacterized protein with HEPN domain